MFAAALSSQREVIGSRCFVSLIAPIKYLQVDCFVIVRVVDASLPMSCSRHALRHRETVEISGARGVNAQSINFLSKSQSIIELIDLRVCALQPRQIITRLIIL
jgi:hypothetical protein